MSTFEQQQIKAIDNQISKQKELMALSDDPDQASGQEATLRRLLSDRAASHRFVYPKPKQGSTVLVY